MKKGDYVEFKGCLHPYIHRGDVGIIKKVANEGVLLEIRYEGKWQKVVIPNECKKYIKVVTAEDLEIVLDKNLFLPNEQRN